MRSLDFTAFSMSTERPAFVMGIVNATPDSFFDASRGGAQKALCLIEEGADILDVGGESTRPGFTDVSEDDELRRVIPVIEAVRRKYSGNQVRISVDTRKSRVFKAAYEAGADILNDVSSMTYDSNMPALVASLGVPVVIMHQGGGTPSDVAAFFKRRAGEITSLGVDRRNIIVDPGIGFGKSSDECIRIIKDTDFLCGAGFPLLMALSRKRCIGAMISRDVQDRLFGTLAADLICVQKGAGIIRVHDVRAAIDTLNVMNFLR